MTPSSHGPLQVRARCGGENVDHGNHTGGIWLAGGGGECGAVRGSVLKGVGLAWAGRCGVVV